MLRRAFISTYSVQIFSALISILLVPIYVDLLGIEKFALIGFLILLQNILLIFDAGIGGALTRQIAIVKTNPSDYKEFLNKFLIILLFFIFIALGLFLFGYINNTFIIEKWIKSDLETSLLSTCINSIFLILALKYVSGLFRNSLMGLEKHTLISAVNFILITFRSPGGLLILYLFDFNISAYFIFQVYLSILELVIFILIFGYYSQKIINSNPLPVKSQHEVSLKSLIILSSQLSILTIVWVIVAQVDKFILSRELNLSEYGYYTLALTISGVLLMFSQPISQILRSRLSVLFSLKDSVEYIKLYANSYIATIIVIIPLSIFLFIFSHQIIFMWTGDLLIADSSYIYSKWLALGNGISVLLAFTFILQYSLGKLKKHVQVYLLYSLLIVPAAIYIANIYKGEGTAFFWFLHNLIFFITWATMVHRRFIKRINSLLYIRILIPVFLISFLWFTIVNYLIDTSEMSRILLGFTLFFVGICDMILISIYLFIYKTKLLKLVTNLRFTNYSYA